MSALSRMCTSVIQYETPKVVTVHNPTIGLLRRSLQIGVVLYVCLYQLWYAQVARDVTRTVEIIGLYLLYRDIRRLQFMCHTITRFH